MVELSESMSNYLGLLMSFLNEVTDSALASD
jgi:hypothetical protein